MAKKKPLLANGSIVGDYDPLFKYWEMAKKIDKSIAENATLRNEDFNYLLKILSRRKTVKLIELLDELEEYMLNRVNAEIAAKALKEIYNVEYSLENARRRIARILAGWLIEASNIWGDVRLKRPQY